MKLKFLNVLYLLFFAAGGILFGQKSDADKAAEGWQNTAPNERHYLLNQFEGSWKVNYVVRPEENPIYGSGSMESAIIFQERYLLMKTNFLLDIFQYESFEYIGYDNIKEKYTINHVDNLTTNFLSLEGTYDETAKRLTFEGMSGNAFHNKDIPHRLIITLERENKIKYELYLDEGSGFRKSFEMNCIKQARTESGK